MKSIFKLVVIPLLILPIIFSAKYIEISNKEYTASSTDTLSQQIKQEIVTSGSGLYADEIEQNRYIFKGNPNNYMTFNNETPKKVTKYSLLSSSSTYEYKLYFNTIEECQNYQTERNNPSIKSVNNTNITQIDNTCIKEEIYEGGWRIVAIEPDGAIKIIRNLSIGDNEWNNSENTDWQTSTLNTYLNNDYYNSIDSESKEKIIKYNFNIGNIASTFSDNDEKTAVWNGYIGLLTPSDFRKAILYSNCSSLPKATNSNIRTAQPIDSECYDESYLIKKDHWWLINRNNENISIAINDYTHRDNPSSIKKTYPVLHLNNVELTGNGTPENPYQIKKKIKVKYNIRMSKSFRAPSSDTIESGTQYNSKEATEIEETSCTFEGWYLDEEFTIPYVEGTELIEDTELYGKCNCPQIVNVPPTSKFIPNFIFIASIAIMITCIYLYRKIFVKSKID